jgi:hypothetical protein
MHGLLALLIARASAPCPSRAQRLLSSLTASTSGAALVSSLTPGRLSRYSSSLAQSSQAVGAVQAVPGAPLALDGSRAADPGEPRYTAPFWIPEDVRRATRLPAVLFTDPWTSHDEAQLRREHARLCLAALRAAGRPLTGAQLFELVANPSSSSAKDDGHSTAEGASGRHVPAPATPAYVKQLLEQLRNARIVFGRKNPDSPLSAGHPEHPRLYEPLAYQAARKGKPELLAAQDEAARKAGVEKAHKRLRNGKPPFPIHRRCG